jgi:mannose-6-phosphate isomerase
MHPLVFKPLFMERIWGGRRLQELFGKDLPANVRIGESWELVDREEAQSVVAAGRWSGRTLHELWMEHRAEVFGTIADAPRFPLLIKLLDASEKLSLQVHPPPNVANELGSQAKTEFWYIAEARPGAELYVGLRNNSSRAALEKAIDEGTVEDHVHRLPVRTGDAMFLPSGRMHAIGAGNVIVEIQQNSDTTYRVFDWNRKDESGTPRRLHVSESLESIDFEDFEPQLLSRRSEALLRDEVFNIDLWELTAEREITASGTFAAVICVSGEIECSGVVAGAGELFLAPADLQDRVVRPRQRGSVLLRVTAGG